ncbi:MAG: pilus assembly protein PilP, partial [Desulfobacterales bacterium]
MSIKNLKYSEMPDDLMDSLSQIYISEKENAANKCHMHDTAIAFASGEFELEENQKFRDHLQTCHFCLNLVLDVKIAESESEANAQQTVAVLPALSKAFKKSKNRNLSFPQSKTKPAFISRARSILIAPKIIAALATACFAFIILYHGFNDSEIFNQFKTINKKTAAQKDEITKPDSTESAVPPEEKVKTERPSAQSKKYNTKGKIDPFETLFQKKPSVALKKAKRKRRTPRTPLEKLDLSQLKLVAIMRSPDGNKALLEDASGKGYVISKGSYIGTNAGKVVEIEKDRVIVAEEVEDAVGNITTQR